MLLINLQIFIGYHQLNEISITNLHVQAIFAKSAVNFEECHSFHNLVNEAVVTEKVGNYILLHELDGDDVHQTLIHGRMKEARIL